MPRKALARDSPDLRHLNVTPNEMLTSVLMRFFAHLNGCLCYPVHGYYSINFSVCDFYLTDDIFPYNL